MERCRASRRGVVRLDPQRGREPWKGRHPAPCGAAPPAPCEPGLLHEACDTRHVTAVTAPSLSRRALAPRPRPRAAAPRHEQRLRGRRHPGPVLRPDPVGLRVPPLQAQVRGSAARVTGGGAGAGCAARARARCSARPPPPQPLGTGAESPSSRPSQGTWVVPVSWPPGTVPLGTTVHASVIKCFPVWGLNTQKRDRWVTC